MEIRVIDGIEYVPFEEVKLEKKLRIRSLISNLSFSEVIAVRNIFKELDGVEGMLVTKNIADRQKITRSVVVQALRKLECAGVIESNSLGMKGTHIKILDKTLLEVLKEVE